MRDPSATLFILEILTIIHPTRLPAAASAAPKRRKGTEDSVNKAPILH